MEQTLRQGEIVGDYIIEEFLGRGGFATVYSARKKKHKKNTEMFALKVGNILGGGRYTNRLLENTNERSPQGISPDEKTAEAIFYGQNGPQIDFLNDHEVDNLLEKESEKLLDAGRTEESPYPKLHDIIDLRRRPILVMDYVRGKTVRERMRNLPGCRLNWFYSIAKKLRSVGAHEDLKPENIIIQNNGSLKLIDPGITYYEPREIRITTPYYNPLLLHGPEADVMAMGIMIYEILSGLYPYDEHSVPFMYAGRELRGEIEQLSLQYFLSHPKSREINSKAPERLERIVEKCLNRCPGYDYGPFIDDLEDFLKG